MGKKLVALTTALSLGLIDSGILFGQRDVGRPGSPGVKNRRKARKKQKQARRRNR